MEEWIRANLPPDEARIFLVHFRALFAGIDSARLVQFLTRLNQGTPARGQPQWGERLWKWDSIFSQLARAQLPATRIIEIFEALLATGSLTGANLHTFWWTALGATGGSDILINCIDPLVSNHNGLNGVQIRDLLLMFLNGTPCTACAAPRIRLSKTQLRDCLGFLHSKQNPLQIRSFCLFFQCNLPAGLNKVDTKFLEICNGVSTLNWTAQQISMTLAVHGTLTNADLARILFSAPLQSCMQFLSTNLPVVALPPTVANSPGALLAYAVAQGSAADVAKVLKAASRANVPVAAIARIFCHLQHMAAGDRVRRLAEFITGAEAHRTTGKRTPTWLQIMNLVDIFVAENRHNNNPATVNGGANMSIGVCRCPGERINYFVRAHTYSFFDFAIVNRTRDDITFFPQGMTVLGMRTLVGHVLNATPQPDIQNALGSAGIQISTVNYNGNDYEVGLLGQNGLTAALIHFMPFTTNPNDYWHKNLLAAIGRLF